MVKIKTEHCYENKRDDWREKYEAVISSERWKERVRPAILERAKNKCERCGAVGDLQIHHLTYRHLGEERGNELLALCEQCHEVADRYREMLSFEKFLYKRFGSITFKQLFGHSIFDHDEF